MTLPPIDADPAASASASAATDEPVAAEVEKAAATAKRRTDARRGGRAGGGRSSARRRSRELALEGLYEWLLGGADAGVVDAHVREREGFAQCDAGHFDALLHGVIAEAAQIDAVLAPFLDRRTALLSPVEHAALMIGVWELRNRVEIPYRVAINEAVELTKAYGGTDGHKYVNGVLDKAAGELRRVEVEAARAERG